jgi:glycosyltransferase involved in cell wall biosynthesis
MNILLLSPQPFYQERGTPIAVNLVLKILGERGDQVDVLTYHEGTEVRHEHVTLHRISKIPFVHGIRPGFSWKKVVCDFFMFFKAIRLVSTKRYDLVHAVEESVFIALVLKYLFKIPYLYDMDSSLTQQMMDKYLFLKPFAAVLVIFERLAVKNAKVVSPVCDALAEMIEVYKPAKIVVVPDVSLLLMDIEN